MFYPARMLSFLLLVCAMVVGCEGQTGGGGAAQKSEMRRTEANHQRLIRAVPPPQLDTSLERLQLKRRLERFNKDSKISYIYLISYGRVMSYYAIRGKVSSVNSLMTTPDQIIESHGSAGRALAVISSPDLDGSYGSNGEAIFFFTTDNVYVEWNGEYMLSDQPLRLAQEPLLTRSIKED